MYQLVAKEIFLTKGVGYHKDKLTSFEEALRKAGIARFNLVDVSSIFPPHCKIVSRNKGLEKLKTGQIVFVVKARNETNENRRLIASSVGLAVPKDKSLHGYLSEHHSFGEQEKKAGSYAEDLAASMLATTLGIKIDLDKSWNERKEIWKLDGKIYKTTNVTQVAEGTANGIWATAIAAAVFVM